MVPIGSNRGKAAFQRMNTALAKRENDIDCKYKTTWLHLPFKSLEPREQKTI